MPTSNEVSLLFREPSGSGVRRRPLRDFLNEAVRLVMPGHSVTCLITDDRELRELNRKFLRKNYPTDVLSFPALRELAGTTERPSDKACSAGSSKASDRSRRRADPVPATDAAAGEIAISLDRAAAQAAEFGHSIEEELRILILHGLLHLAGMDHESDAGEMARAEARWRKRLQLPPGLVERARA